MWMVDDALEGRVTVGKTRSGGGEEEYILKISGKRLFQLQKFLEEAGEHPTNFFHARMAVLLWEELRRGVLSVGLPGPPPGGVDAG